MQHVALWYICRVVVIEARPWPRGPSRPGLGLENLRGQMSCPWPCLEGPGLGLGLGLEGPVRGLGLGLECSGLGLGLGGQGLGLGLGIESPGRGLGLECPGFGLGLNGPGLDLQILVLTTTLHICGIYGGYMPLGGANIA